MSESKPKVSPPRTAADVDHDLRTNARLRDLGRLRGEVRPLPRVIDDLLEERTQITTAARAAEDQKVQQ